MTQYSVKSPSSADYERTFLGFPFALFEPKIVGCQCVLEHTVEYPREENRTLLNIGIRM
jgi:hypothetical protein